MMNVDLIVYDVPGTVMRKLTGDARRRNVSVNDAAVAIVSAALDIERDATGAPFRQPPTTQTLKLNMPERVRRQLKMDAAANGDTMRGLVIHYLATHYNLNAPSARRRARGTATTTT